MAKKNKIIQNLFIEKIWYWGIWIWKLDNKKKVLVKWNLYPWCKVNCLITKQKKDYIEAKLLEIVDKGNVELQKPLCPHYKNFFSKYFENLEEIDETKNGCWGCKRQILSYTQQLNLKMQIVLDSFRWYQDILENTSFYDIIWTWNYYFYRNKIEFSFWKYIKKEYWQKNAGSDIFDKEWENFIIKKDFQVGFHKQWMFSKVIDVDKCFLISDKMNSVFSHIKDLCLRSWLPVHDQKIHEWFFRHLVIRQGYNTDQILVNLVVYSDWLQNQEQLELWTNLQEVFKKDEFLKSQVNSFCITFNNWLADVVKWENIENFNLWWDWYIFEQLHFLETKKIEKDYKTKEIIIEDWQIKTLKTLNSWKTQNDENVKTLKVSFRVSPFSFFQTNTNWAQILFSTAFELIGNVNWTILDLYCWTWSIGISLLKQWKGNFLIWVEIVEDAIIDANYNAKINGLQNNVYFVAWKAEKIIYEDLLIQEKIKDLSLIIVDPPRDWLHKNVIKFLNEIKKTHQTKLLYISCNPVTMARDLKLLYEWGWKIDVLQPVDMFPQTHHIEMIWIIR